MKNGLFPRLMQSLLYIHDGWLYAIRPHLSIEGCYLLVNWTDIGGRTADL